MNPDFASIPLPAPPVTPLRWEGDWQSGALSLLDQTRLPGEETWVHRRDHADVIDDIYRLAVRGAPAIGITGGYALVLAAREVVDGAPGLDAATFRARLAPLAEAIAAARPTAVNLGVAVRRGLAAIAELDAEPAVLCAALLDAAVALDDYEREACGAIARHGAAWIAAHVALAERPRSVLTHCNAGALVSTGLGTALAPLYLLHAAGTPLRVFADETRPLLQGMRLTSYELSRAGVPNQVLGDGAAAGLVARGEVDAVLVGSDRIAANGDVANKVGTYGLALAAARHGIPFLVAAPCTTIDLETATGTDIPIESRPADLARYVEPGCLAEGTEAFAPAFDVTPADLVTALFTERGTVEAPDRDKIAQHLA